jgi:hypothetical protein
MGQMSGVWPEEQAQEFDDVFEESRRRMTAEESYDWCRRWIVTLTSEDRYALPANLSNAVRVIEALAKDDAVA